MGFFSFINFTKSSSKTANDIYTSVFTKEILFDVINSSDTMMLFFSKKDGWVGANKAFLNKLNYKNIEEFRKKYSSVRDMFFSESEDIFTEDDKSWLDYIKKHKKSGYDVNLYDHQNKNLNIRLKCKAISQNKEFYILELNDVSELYRANQKTEDAEKLKTKFLSNIGHEFRTPMNGILGFVDLLQETDLDKKQSEYVQMISRSSNSLMTNIEILLDLSQLQGGRLNIDNYPFELIPHMEELVLKHVDMAREKGINLLNFIDPKIPKELNSDIRKIKQITSSLLQNAIKFTQRGGRVIFEIKLLKKQLNGDCSIGFSVKDNGKGIAREDIATIVNPFNSGNQADERLGVGLSLSNGLVKLLGSELNIQSELSQGSYFNFVLNFKASKGQTYKMMPKKKVKVLLLDSTKIDNANFLTTYLRSFAIDVVKSSTLDENIYHDIETLYIVANQNNSSWLLKLGTYTKKVPVVILLDRGEKLQTKLTHIVDKVIYNPLFPSVISKHLASVHNINLQSKRKVKLVSKEKINVLVVEDNLINQRLIQIMLKEYNAVVSVASNGNEAVEACVNNKFDIVFMDIDMPQKNGIVATKEIKNMANLNHKTPIVALTALAMQGDRERILGEGLDDYLSKPLTRDKLSRILNKYLKVMFV
jgi:CheY-like chemotaxis protein/nitrogen-specific signal transduction histidine kinase